MPERRPLKFGSEQDVIADVERLRREGYEQAGEWSLPRACWHLSRVIDMTLKPAAPGARATPEQSEKKNRFLETLAAGMPSGMPSPPDANPPPRVELSAIDEFIAKTQGLTTCPHAMVDVPVLGLASLSEIRQMHLAHAAHHLSFLIPNT